MFKFVDLHCDTITTANAKNENFLKNNLHIDIERLNTFKQPTQIFAIWLNKKYYSNAFKITNEMIDFFENQINSNKKYISTVRSFSDIIKNEKNNKISAILSIEGGESLENNIENLQHFYNRGVRILTLCWNYENRLGFGACTNSKAGLKQFGKNVVKKMNDIGMIIDVSHLNETGFWDLCKLSDKPFIATHSNAYSICKHFRNLKDEQLKAIKECGGVIGINLYPPFLTENKIATLEDVFKHIEYMENIIGIDNICLGADFDGIDETPIGIEDISKYHNLFENIENKYGKDILEKICYKNFYKFLENNIPT